MTALMGLEARLRLARLYLCTDAREQQGDLETFLQAAFAGGVDIVQIRQKGMKPEAELEALEIARQVAAPYQAIVCVNDSAELAQRFQADMLHLGQTDGSSAKARRGGCRSERSRTWAFSPGLNWRGRDVDNPGACPDRPAVSFPGRGVKFGTVRFPRRYTSP